MGLGEVTRRWRQAKVVTAVRGPSHTRPFPPQVATFPCSRQRDVCALQLQGYNLTGTLPGSALVGLGLTALILENNPGGCVVPAVAIVIAHAARHLCLLLAKGAYPSGYGTWLHHNCCIPIIPCLGLAGYLPVELLQQPNISLVSMHTRRLFTCSRMCAVHNDGPCGSD